MFFQLFLRVKNESKTVQKRMCCAVRLFNSNSKSFCYFTDVRYWWEHWQHDRNCLDRGMCMSKIWQFYFFMHALYICCNLVQSSCYCTFDPQWLIIRNTNRETVRQTKHLDAISSHSFILLTPWGRAMHIWWSIWWHISINIASVSYILWEVYFHFHDTNRTEFAQVPIYVKNPLNYS